MHKYRMKKLVSAFGTGFLKPNPLQQAFGSGFTVLDSFKQDAQTIEHGLIVGDRKVGGKIANLEGSPFTRYPLSLFNYSKKRTNVNIYSDKKIKGDDKND